MASQKEEVKLIGGTTGNLFSVPPQQFTPNPDNPREDTAERRAWVRTLADDMISNGYDRNKPITYRKLGDEWIVEDGNQRLEEVLLAISEGASILTITCLPDVEGANEEQRLARRITRNTSLAHTAADYAGVILKFRSWGHDDAAIAKRLERSKSWLDGVMMLASAPERIREMVRTHQVSPTEAVRTIRQQGAAKAISTLQRASEAVNGHKVTRKSIEAVQAHAKPPMSITPYAVRVAEVWSEMTEEFIATVPDEFRLVLDALRGKVR